MSYKTTVKVESLHKIFPLHFALKMKNVQHIDDKLLNVLHIALQKMIYLTCLQSHTELYWAHRLLKGFSAGNSFCVLEWWFNDFIELLIKFIDFRLKLTLTTLKLLIFVASTMLKKNGSACTLDISYFDFLKCIIIIFQKFTSTFFLSQNCNLLSHNFDFYTHNYDFPWAFICFILFCF